MRAPEAQPDRYSPERLAETPSRRRPPAGAPTPGRRATDRPAAARTPAPSLPEGHPSAPVPGHPAAAAAPAARPAVPARSSAPAAAPAQGRPPVPVPAPQPAGAGAKPWSTAPTGLRADRPRPASAALAAGLRAPVQPGTHPSGPIYGDWTKPSRSGADDDRVVPPATTAIPERETARRGAPEVDDDHDELDDYDDDRYEDDDRYVEDDAYDDELDEFDEPAPAPSAAPAPSLDTGPSTMVRGGRAKDRLARQAADERRRKELKAEGETMTAKAYLAGDDLDGKRSPRRTIIALVAVAVVALGVLGVYSFVSPATKEASSGGSAGTSTAAAPPAGGIADATLPELSISTPPVVAEPPADVKAPVTVLNETGVNGLAGRISGQLQAAGWETPATAAYPGSDIAVTTVYYTDGDTTQQQAAQALVNAFPQIHGPAVRFFDVPGQPTPGLVVVAAGDWQP